MQYGDDMYEERIYREKMPTRELYRTRVVEKESDLLILTSENFYGHDEVKLLRNQISQYIERRPEFLGLSPIAMDHFAPEIVKRMIEASSHSGVGPMACVAGAISHFIGEYLDDNREIMIENGGDIYLKSNEDKVVAIYAGESSFSNQVGLKIKSEDTPIGICTSAGKVGHSLSFGSTDAVVVLSEDTLLADATATAIGNIVKTADDIRLGLEFGKKIPGILGIVIIIDEELGAWGGVELVSIDER